MTGLIVPVLLALGFQAQNEAEDDWWLPEWVQPSPFEREIPVRAVSGPFCPVLH